MLPGSNLGFTLLSFKALGTWEFLKYMAWPIFLQGSKVSLVLNREGERI